MKDMCGRLEDARLSKGLTQAALAGTLGITQPHYSKIAGAVVEPGSDLADRIEAWLADGAKGEATPRPASHVGLEIGELTRSIERQSRRLAGLLARHGIAAPRRGVRRSRRADAPRT